MTEREREGRERQREGGRGDKEKFKGVGGEREIVILYGTVL